MARTDVPHDAVHDSPPAEMPERQTMIPARERRRFRAESVLMRLVATAGIVAFGVLLGAILVSSDVAGWIVGLVVALVSVVLAGVLWSSRQL
jgi:protein-S-isoprenylcysteine O-methyltransferase Ste14